MWTTKDLNVSRPHPSEISSADAGNYSDDFKRSFNPKRLHNNGLLREAIAAHSFHSGREIREQVDFEKVREIIREMAGIDDKKNKSPDLIEDSKPRNDGRDVLTDARRGVKKPSLNDFMNRRMSERKKQLLNDSDDKKKKNDERQMLMG